MTEKFDPKAALAKIGVDPAIAETLVSKLQGGDYVNLISALNNPDPSQARLEVKKILIKYGVNPAMTKENTVSENAYLQSRFNALKTGKADTEWLQPINESTGDFVLLRESGYNYQANIPTAIVDPMIDWLDANQIEYLTDGNHFQMKCHDPETQFSISHKINDLFDKAEARDHHGNETMRESKSAKKREAAAKEKLANLKPQNPIVQAMSQRTGGGVHKSSAEDPRKADKFGRKAKHRRDPMDESYEIGESVLVDGYEATVQIPHGPNGTIGVIMDGELTMVSESQVQLNEGVLGMTSMNPLFRLRELAGLAPAPIASPGIEAEAKPAVAVDLSDDLGDLGDLEGAEPAVPMSGMDPDPTDDLENDLGLDGPASLASDPVNGGVPGDLPPAGGMDAMAAPQSDAMAQIEDALNGIQRQLADIRLSEYKTVMRKLQDLTNQVQMMGRDYLGERRRK